MELKRAAYTVFDVETTGLYPYAGDRICEIGALRVDPSGKKNTFEALVNPGRPVSRGAYEVNRITAEMLEGKPLIEDVLPDFMAFIEGSVLVAYNAGFDMGFIDAALGSMNHILYDFRIIDALKLARSLFPHMGRYNLAHVANSLGFDTGAKHRALGDAVMTEKIFGRERDILETHGVHTVDEIAESPRPRSGEYGAKESSILKTIEEAARDKSDVRITYRSVWDNRMTERVITPKTIRRGYDKLYVIAYCGLRGEERNFRMDCILSAEYV